MADKAKSIVRLRLALLSINISINISSNTPTGVTEGDPNLSALVVGGSCKAGAPVYIPPAETQKVFRDQLIIIFHVFSLSL